MAQRKSSKGQTTIYKTKDRLTRTLLKTGETQVLQKGKQL